MKRNGIIFLVVLSFSLGILQPVYAQDSSSISLREVLKKHRHKLTLEDGELAGPGGEWLVDRAKEADFITLGESHGTKEIPQLMSVLIKELQQAGEFDQLAIEVSPWTAQELENHLREGKKAYNKFISSYPASTPFYNWEIERDLLYQAVSGSEDDRKIVGMDQIFSFSTKLALDRLKNLAPNSSIKSKIKEIEKNLSRRAKKDPELQKIPENMPPPITLFRSSAIDSLHLWFDSIPEAEKLLDEIERSIKIYKLNDSNNYRSNQIRARLMRKNLSRAIRSYTVNNDSISGYVIKTGAMHAYKGMTPNNALDVGNLAESIADIRGGKAFNVAILCGPGSKGQGFPQGTESCWPGILGEELKSLSKNSAVLFDLTALHPVLHQNKINPPKNLEEFLWAFDAVVLIPDATPAYYIRSLKK